MIRLRRVHAAAAIVNGLALCCALLRQPIAGVMLLALSSTLLIWSLEQLRHQLIREPR